ncbi:nuclear transport factor 2 family protein [Jeotgalibacillus sp. ET6]|uniref:YybH family protein n=1 Tax=Jeotgalibacillus sp. ET6 TaxID=3037260 RepID=UPI002418749C|nr:nuclear transport factor 2 family protein [Jeotgalibacillus sp. ET6]MDG5471587.1 nuclear transport factor 2 family protein [Jeotgalibacillus sp. ET6]
MISKKMRTAIGAGLLALLLAACSGDETNDNTGSVNDGQNGEGIDTHTQSEDSGTEGDSEIGFEMNSEGEVEKAEDVPPEEEEAILSLFDEYISTFNEKDIDGYLQLLRTGDGYFNEDEERAALEEVFESFDVEREVELKTINEYKEDEAHVFANMILTTTDTESGAEVTRTGRQITVFHLVEDEWKIASIHFMADPE